MSGWGDWLEKGKALAATIDQQINESVGLESNATTTDAPGAATADDLNDAWNDDFDDDIILDDIPEKQPAANEPESPFNGWNNEEEEQVIMENFQDTFKQEPPLLSPLPPPVENDSILSSVPVPPVEPVEDMTAFQEKEPATLVTDDHFVAPMSEPDETEEPVANEGWDDDLHVDSHDMEEELLPEPVEEPPLEVLHEEPQPEHQEEVPPEADFHATLVQLPPVLADSPAEPPATTDISEPVKVIPEPVEEAPDSPPVQSEVETEKHAEETTEQVVEAPPVESETTMPEQEHVEREVSPVEPTKEESPADESFALQSQAEMDDKVLQLQEENQMAVALLQSQMEDLQIQLGQREDQLTSKAEQLTTMQAMFESEKDELRKKIADTKEEAKRRILKAKERVEAMEKRLANASKSADEAGAQSEIIAALREEGEKLARKQSEMEKAVRAAKGETRDLREQLDAETASKDKALAKIASLEAELKKTKEDLTAARKGESQVVKLDAELLSMKEECERKATTNLSLEQQVKELKAENKELRTEVEQARRGAELEKQDESKKLKKEHNDLLSDLENKLRTSEREANLREDALRHEVAEIRKRWQDAVRRADGKCGACFVLTYLRQLLSLPLYFD